MILLKVAVVELYTSIKYIHQSSITLWPLTGKANNTDYLIIIINAGSDRNVSDYTEQHSFLCMGVHGCRSAREPDHLYPPPKAPSIGTWAYPLDHGAAGLMWRITLKVGSMCVAYLGKTCHQDALKKAKLAEAVVWCFGKCSAGRS